MDKLDKKTKKRLDTEIEKIYYKHASGVQIKILDLSKIFQAGYAAHLREENLEQAIVDAIAKYRQN